MKLRCLIVFLYALFLVTFFSIPLMARQVAMNKPRSTLEPSRNLSVRKIPKTLLNIISLDFENISLEKALKTVSEKGNFELIYIKNFIPVERRITLKLDNVPAIEALKKVLEQTSTDIAVSSGGQITLVPAKGPSNIVQPLISQQQTITTIKGKVIDEMTGHPLVGANVMILDFKVGAAADKDGNYSFTIPQRFMTAHAGHEEEIVCQFMGFHSKTKKITLSPGTITTRFALAIDVLELDALIVTGLGGTQVKEKLGVSIDKVESRAIVESDQSNVVAALRAKSPNVEVTQNTGDPGGSAYIKIRGASTIKMNTQPLFVVDGIPINNSTRVTNLTYAGPNAPNRASDLNVEDIASIEILKGATASAIYGSRAANGVILITTKSGRPGKVKIEYKTSYSWDKVNKMPPLQRKYGQGLNGIAIDNSYFSWGPKLDSSTPTYDHAWEIFETGHNFDNYISMSGGIDRTTFFISAGRLVQDGVLKGHSDYDKTTFRIKATQLISEKWKMTGSASYINTEANYVPMGEGYGSLSLLHNALVTPPDFNNQPYLDPASGLHRTYQYQNPTELRSTLRGNDNPFFVMNEGVNNSDAGRLIANLNVEFTPLDWLTISNILGSDFTSDDRLDVTPVGSTYPDGNMIRINFLEHEIENNLVATAQLDRWLTQVNKNITGTFMGGYNINRREFSVLKSNGSVLSVPDWWQLDNCLTVTVDEYESLRHIESYFGHLTLDLYDQLYLTGAIRNDGSSTFGVSKRRHWYPKGSTAWEFTKFTKIPHLNFGKLRFAYGVAGTEPEPYATSSGFEKGSLNEWSGSLSSTYMGYDGYFVSRTRGQENIMPERTEEFEIGTELSFLNSRIGLEYNYYQSETKDIIFQLPLALSTGYQFQLQNAAAIKNKGHELSINIQAVRTKKITWGIDLLWATNDNIVTDLGGAERLHLSGWSMQSAVEGEPVGVFWYTDYYRFGRGSKVGGVDIDNAYTSWKTGDLYIAEDGYPMKDSQHHKIGDPNPNWTGSIYTDITLFGNLRLSGLIDIKHGGDMYNGDKNALTYAGVHKDTEVDRYVANKVFEGAGPGAGKKVVLNGPYRWQGGGWFFPLSDWVEPAGFVKLREISIAYTFDHDFIKKLGLSHIDVRFSGRNLKTWTDYPGIDPDVNHWGNSNIRGTNYRDNPQTKSYVLTLRYHY